MMSSPSVLNICPLGGAMSPLASRSDEINARDTIASLSMGLNVDPEWGVPLSATPTPTGTPALGQKDFDRRIKRKYETLLFHVFLSKVKD